jgi:hypothetical protein
MVCAAASSGIVMKASAPRARMRQARGGRLAAGEAGHDGRKIAADARRGAGLGAREQQAAVSGSTTTKTGRAGPLRLPEPGQHRGRKAADAALHEDMARARARGERFADMTA